MEAVGEGPPTIKSEQTGMASEIKLVAATHKYLTDYYIIIRLLNS